jgi:hypothetical protein
MFEGFVSHALLARLRTEPIVENTHQVPTQKTSGHLMKHSNPRQEGLSVRLLERRQARAFSTAANRSASSALNFTACSIRAPKCRFYKAQAQIATKRHLGVDSIVIGFYGGETPLRSAGPRWLRSSHTPPGVPGNQGTGDSKCPFVNLPETDAGPWSQGPTAEKMKECAWVQPERVAESEFLEWTAADHLRHTKFVRLENNKKGAPSEAGRELLLNA